MKNVVILGCPRSGTSIFGELFEFLPNYQYYFEPGIDFLAQLDYTNTHYAVKNPTNVGRRAWAERSAGLSVNIEQLRREFPYFKLFWIVRHPYDTVCSLRPGLAKGRWRHPPQPPHWEALQERMTLVERCAYQWMWVNEMGYALVQDEAQVIKYENLVLRPVETINHVLEAAEISSTLQTCAPITQYIESISHRNEGYQAEHQKQWATRDHEVRVGRWRENLSQSDVDLIHPIVKYGAETFGYDVPTYLKDRRTPH